MNAAAHPLPALGMPTGQRYCGATPHFDRPGWRLTFPCTADDTVQPQWQDAAAGLVAQLSARHAAAPQLKALAAEAAASAPSPHPLAWAWHTLARTAGLPPHVLRTNMRRTPAGETTVELFTALPYDACVQTCLRLVHTWLNWAHRLLMDGQLQLPQGELASWLQGLESLPGLLPAPALLQWHHRLSERGIDWQWRGASSTVVGSGVRRRAAEGVPAGWEIDDPDAWRIPIYTVTGSVGKTTTARLLWMMLQSACPAVGLTASDGAWVGSQQVAKGDCIGGVSAQSLLRNAAIEAAVFEQGRGGLLRQGVPYSRSDVAILLNVQEVHLGIDGIHTLQEMADTKALGVHPARLAVLNLDDLQCRRIGMARPADRCAWFSTTRDGASLATLSLTSHGTAGVLRDEGGQPLALALWQQGQQALRVDLRDVRPYHGMLGEKTLEELLAAVLAAFIGPIRLQDWSTLLPRLKLDRRNHRFRTSVHRQGRIVFVLDKAGEDASLTSSLRALDEIEQNEGTTHRIAVITRPAGEPPERHVRSAHMLHPHFDEFLCFDRPETYETASALPVYTRGSIPLVLARALEEANAAQGTAKPVSIAPNWAEAEAWLTTRLAARPGCILVFINQTATTAPAQPLNDRILQFVEQPLNLGA